MLPCLLAWSIIYQSHGVYLLVIASSLTTRWLPTPAAPTEGPHAASAHVAFRSSILLAISL